MAEVMIIENHALSRQFLKSSFVAQGYRVLEAVDSTTALAKARTRPPDLIISSILLPKLNGIEFARRLRSLPGMDSIPIMFYTAACRFKGELNLGNNLGACSVVPKPSDPRLIIETADELLIKTRRPSPLAPLAHTAPGPALVAEQTKVKLRLAPELAGVEIDCCQIMQAVDDLVRGAQQVNPFCGSVIIEADNVEICADNPLALVPGQYVRIASIDGTGVKRADVQQVLIPVTSQVGIGLGLATAERIIEVYGGAIEIKEWAKIGTVLMFNLPAARRVMP